MALTESMFAADVMEAGGEVAFEEMKVPELKDELALRGSTRTGLKAVLQRRLHALLVQAAIERSAGGMDLLGGPRRPRRDFLFLSQNRPSPARGAACGAPFDGGPLTCRNLTEGHLPEGPSRGPNFDVLTPPAVSLASRLPSPVRGSSVGSSRSRTRPHHSSGP